MYQNFDAIIAAARELPVKRTACIAGAADGKILHVAAELVREGLCRVLLVGDRAEIGRLAPEQGLDPAAVTVLHEPDAARVGLTAVAQVHGGAADIFVKGKMNTSDFLHAVLDKEAGLRTGDKLSVLTCYDVPGQKKLFFLTDGGMIVAPTLEDKAVILHNAVGVLHSMGISRPKVAILSANEKVSPGMPSTVDAAELCAMAERGELPEAVYEGPIAFDVAMRPDAAAEKGIASRVSGDVDLFLVPNIETGNCLGKSIGYFGGGQTAGIVIGASRPVVMSSRAASVKGKLTAIAWALLACGNRKESDLH